MSGVERFLVLDQAQRDAMVELLDKRASDGPTPCMGDPARWEDDPSTGESIQRRRERLNRAAIECVAGCHALWQCRRFADLMPDLEGAIAGQVRGVKRRPNSQRATAGPATSTEAADQPKEKQ